MTAVPYTPALWCFAMSMTTSMSFAARGIRALSVAERQRDHRAIVWGRRGTAPISKVRETENDEEDDEDELESSSAAK